MFNEKNRTGNSVVPANVKLEDMEFVGLKDFIGKEIHVQGYFFSEGKFGTQVSIIAEGKKINMPKRCVEEFASFTEEEKKAVLAGKLILTDIKEANTKNGTTTVFKFADAE